MAYKKGESMGKNIHDAWTIHGDIHANVEKAFDSFPGKHLVPLGRQKK
jgi:hypothetical protein